MRAFAILEHGKTKIAVVEALNTSTTYKSVVIQTPRNGRSENTI